MWACTFRSKILAVTTLQLPGQYKVFMGNLFPTDKMLCCVDSWGDYSVVVFNRIYMIFLVAYVLFSSVCHLVSLQWAFRTAGQAIKCSLVQVELVQRLQPPPPPPLTAPALMCTHDVLATSRCINFYILEHFDDIFSVFWSVNFVLSPFYKVSMGKQL